MKIVIICALIVLSVTHAHAQTLIVGLNADIHGNSAKGGEAVRRGAQMAIDDINSSELLPGIQLDLVVTDHRGNPARGADNVKAFADNPQVIAILGGIHTPVVMHELPLIHEREIPYLVPWAAGTPVIDNGYEPNYVFRLSVRDEYAGEVLLRHAKNTGIKKVALFLERTGWGRSNERSMMLASADLGIKVSKVRWFNWGEAVFDKAIDDAVNAGAQAIMLVANATEGESIIRAMAKRDSGSRIPIISHWGLSSGDFVQNVGHETLQKVDIRMLQTYLFEDKKHNKIAQTILSRYQEQYPDSAGYIEAVPGFVHSYDLINLLALAIHHSANKTRQDVRANLEKLPAHQGLIRLYNPAFTPQRHEALDANDYRIARYNAQGMVVPWE